MLMTPDADPLFDLGFISCHNDGSLLVSPVVDVPSMQRMCIDPDLINNVGVFRSGQRAYLDYYRDFVFLQAKLGQ